jgi:hypothetical protein
LTQGGQDDDILFSSPMLADAAKLDVFDIQFYGVPYMPVTGTFDLTSANNNDNYATCDQCVYLYQDIDPVTEIEDKFFFQSEGTLTVTETDPSLPNVSKGSLTNVKLVEVTLDANYNSTPVPNGVCYVIPTLSWDTMTP